MKGTREIPAAVAATYRAQGYWRDQLIGDQLRWSATEFPEKTAVVHGATRLTYRQLDGLVEQAASALRGHGVGAGDVVSFQLPNSIPAVVAYHAIVRIGAVANPITPIYRAREVGFVLRQARTTLAFIPGHYRGVDYPAMYRELAAGLLDLKTCVVVCDSADVAAGAPDGFLDWAGFLASAPDTPPEDEPVDPDDVTLLLYTSGTTSDPKGVLHTHNTWLYDAHAMCAWYGLNETDTIFNPAPVTHASGLLCGVVIPPTVGATMVLQDQWDAAAAVEAIEAERATFMLFATPFLQGLADLPDIASRNLRSVRYVVCGGADVPVALVRNATAALGTVVRMYGSSEVPSMTTCSRHDPPAARAETDGRWMLPTSAYLVAADGRRIDGPGEGEIRVSGPEVFVGYLDASLNAESFDASGAFRTGDVGRLSPEGYLSISGRIKDIINRSGEKFSAREIEELLYEHPAVKDVTVVALPHPRTVEQGCAVVVVRDGHSAPTLPELQEYLDSRGLSKRKWPERLEIVTEIPRTASGKIQKFVLQARYRGADAS